MNTRRGFAPILIVVILGLVAVVGYLVYQNRLTAPATNQEVSPPSPFGDSAKESGSTCVTNGVYDNKKYSFVIPDSFEIESEGCSETESGITIVNIQNIRFELKVNKGGSGLQCYKLYDEYFKEVDGINVKWKIFRGFTSGESPICTSDKSNDYHVWIILKEYVAPGEGIEDLVWYSFDTTNVSFEDAMNTLDQILSTFQFLD